MAYHFKEHHELNQSPMMRANQNVLDGMGSSVWNSFNHIHLTMRWILIWIFLTVCIQAVSSVPASGTGGSNKTPKKKNVLMIIADDLRPQIDIYKDLDIGIDPFPRMYTPNIDELSSKSLVLGRAYSQVAICNPSRSSFLTARRPDTTRVYDSNTYWRSSGGDFTTLPQYFKNHGYLSIGMGKVFHPGRRASDNDDPLSWSLDSYPYYHAESEDYWRMSGKFHSHRKFNTTYDYELKDEEIATKAVETLQQIAPEVEEDKSFFMAVGFRLPHLPLVVPKRYLDYYPINEIQFPSNPDPTTDMPPVAWYTGSELKEYEDINRLSWNGAEKSTLPPHTIKSLRRYYYAAVSYVDYQIGRILKQLEDLKLSDNTIVVLLSDHGYQLGEHRLWTKNTNFEIALQVPLMIHVPGRTTKMQVTTKIVELIDLFPTLVELAGLPELDLCHTNVTLNSQTKVCREGSSFVSLIDNPNQPDGKQAAFSQVYRSPYQSMGYSVRTSRYRYTEWVRFNIDTGEALWDQPLLGTELYDHMTDPQENKNLVEDDRMSMRILRQELSLLLREGWRSKNALPKKDWPVISGCPSVTNPPLVLHLLALCFLIVNMLRI